MEEVKIRASFEVPKDAGKELARELQKQMDRQPVEVRLHCAFDTRGIRSAAGAVSAALRSTADEAARAQRAIGSAIGAFGGGAGSGPGLEGLNGMLQQIQKTLAQVQPQVQVFTNALSSSSAGKTNLYDMIGSKLGTAMTFISAYEKSSQILGNKGAGRPKAGSQDMPANGPAATRNERAA